MAEEFPSTPPPPPLKSPVLLRQSRVQSRLSTKDQVRVEIIDLYRNLSDNTNVITLDTILKFLRVNKISGSEFLRKKIPFIEFIYKNKSMFEEEKTLVDITDDAGSSYKSLSVFNMIEELFESLEHIKTSIKLIEQGIPVVGRTGFYNKYLKYKKKYLALKIKSNLHK